MTDGPGFPGPSSFEHWYHAMNPRWGGGAVERAGLENRYGLRVIVGSNPTPTVASNFDLSMAMGL